MENYNNIVLATMENYDHIVFACGRNQITDITYEEYVMYMASPEKDWRYIAFCKDNRYHRLDGPAIIWAYGRKEWRVNSQLHRLDGPAIEYAVPIATPGVSGAVHIYSATRAEWHVNGKLHRIDGFAVENFDGTGEWWVNGKECKCIKKYHKAIASWNRFMARERNKHE